MPTPQQWNTALSDKSWQLAYAYVEANVREFLRDQISLAYSTRELVEAIYPQQFARGDGILARKRIFKALTALATRGLADCCTRGEPKLNRMKQTIRPWIWHEPRTPNAEAIGNPKLCPHCGGAL